MSHAVSPLAPKAFPTLPPIAGRAARDRARPASATRTAPTCSTWRWPRDTAVAGVFTRSKCPSAPVDWCRANLAAARRGRSSSIPATPTRSPAGRAREAVRMTADMAAAGAPAAGRAQVFLASTGVIGEPLDAAKFEGVLDGTASRRAAPDAWLDAARAIMTTDTFPKVATRTRRARRRRGHHQRHRQGRRHDRARHGDDARPSSSPTRRSRRRCCRRCSRKGADKSFNCVTVDGDTSTSDTLLLFATGEAGARRAAITLPSDRRLARFRAGARRPSRRSRPAGRARRRGRAQVRRPSGHRRDRATPRRSASRMSIANSPLVKTAIAGEDANWGRVVMAVGKAGEPADRDKLAIWFGDIRVAVKGARDPAYDEAATSAYMKGDEIADPRRSRPRPRRGDGVDLRPHQGLRRDQRRLPAADDGRSLKLTLVAAVALIDADSRVLIAQRPEGKQLAGLWEFPGRQGRARRAAGGDPDPRAPRGARHRRAGGLPRAAHLREPRLRELPPPDAALCLPALGGLRAGRARARR